MQFKNKIHAQLNIQYSPILIINIYKIGFSSFTITEGTFSPHMDTQTRPHRWSNLCMLHEYRELHHNIITLKTLWFPNNALTIIEASCGVSQCQHSFQGFQTHTIYHLLAL